MAITITGFTPTGGPTTGGTSVVLTGTQLDLVDDVLFGNVPGTIDTHATNTATSLTVLSPAIPNDGTLVVKISVIDNGTMVEAQSSGNYTYTTVSLPPLTSTLTRKWRVQVDGSTGKDGSGYTIVRGIKNFQPAVAPTMQDDSDYDSDGWGSDVKTMMKWSLVLKLARKAASGFVEDPGQKIIRLAHDQFDTDGVVRVRWYDLNGSDEAYEGYAQVQWSEDGGDPTTLSMVSVTLTGQGARTVIANPA